MSTVDKSPNSCVETPDAPEWLSKLENRREKLKRAKLGHEYGAGAPCNECGDKCPGLDLHFWRKLCRNCKCRKEQHEMSTEDDFSGWAQFEILGQIRSKPAYIKIKALSSQPVQVEWVPPNASPDVVESYMEKLGTGKIPVSGSDAALKRRQQLAFQVPLHDLDAELCDNLTECEATQLQQYVQKIRENCVGQGNVIRVGTVSHATIGYIVPKSTIEDRNYNFSPEYILVMTFLDEVPLLDPVLAELLKSEELAKAIMGPTPNYGKTLKVFVGTLAESSMDFDKESLLCNSTKMKLKGLDKKIVQSLIQNGNVYDKILNVLKNKKLNISQDPTLGPISTFRNEYVNNPKFKQEMDAFCALIAAPKPHYATPVKSKVNDFSFHSPLPLRNAIGPNVGVQLQQDTPIRKVIFPSSRECGLPANVNYEKDPVFAQILNAEALRNALHNASCGHHTDPLIISATSMIPDIKNNAIFSTPVKEKLQSLHVNLKALISAAVNGPFYDHLFQALQAKNIDFTKCKLLFPLKQLREELQVNKPLCEEVRHFIMSSPNTANISLGNRVNFAKNAMKASGSSDSGFYSKPSTPNYNSYPNSPLHAEQILANAGKFASIPGIEDMNMYPSVEVGVHELPSIFNNLELKGDTSDSQKALQLELTCHDCKEKIKFGDIAVTAERRAGTQFAWHPECFKCHTCQELLADLVYFFYNGNVYCGRDLAIKLKIPRCKACDELIFTKEYTAAEGETFHIKHFCCYHCDTPLAGHQYIPDEKTNMPLCLVCYDKFFAPNCQRCQHAIGPADQGVAWGEIHWHGSCFKCAGANCDKSLIGGRFCVKQNLPFCSPTCVRTITN